MSDDDGEAASVEFTTELVMVRALERGLSLNDFEVLTLGQIIDFVTVFNDLQGNQKESQTKMATQSDFDAF